MSPGASLLVIALTLFNIVGVTWLLWWTRRSPGGVEAETTGHVWDGDLTEYNHPLPRWWLWTFLLSIVFGLAYFALYPGLGNFAGLLGWTQEREHAEQSAQYEATLQRTLAPFQDATVEALAQDPAATRIGRNLFMNTCAACHGSDGRGAPGFPNLTDDAWHWGGTPDAIVATITDGRIGVMTPWRDVLGAQGVIDTTAYVLSLHGTAVSGGDAQQGKVLFEQFCAACHGADARGNTALGAPDLTDDSWLHGGSEASIRATIADGRQGEMPAFGPQFGDVRVKLLAAYVLSLHE